MSASPNILDWCVTEDPQNPSRVMISIITNERNATTGYQSPAPSLKWRGIARLTNVPQFSPGHPHKRSRGRIGRGFGGLRAGNWRRWIIGKAWTMRSSSWPADIRKARVHDGLVRFSNIVLLEQDAIELSSQGCYFLIHRFYWTFVSGRSAVKSFISNAFIIRCAKKSNLPNQLCRLVIGRSRC